MSVFIPITIYAVALVSLILAVIFGGTSAIKSERRAFFQAPSNGEFVTGCLTLLFGVVAWVGFPVGTLTLIIWAVLTLAG